MVSRPIQRCVCYMTMQFNLSLNDDTFNDRVVSGLSYLSSPIQVGFSNRKHTLRLFKLEYISKNSFVHHYDSLIIVGLMIHFVLNIYSMFEGFNWDLEVQWKLYKDSNYLKQILLWHLTRDEIFYVSLFSCPWLSPNLNPSVCSYWSTLHKMEIF